MPRRVFAVGGVLAFFCLAGVANGLVNTHEVTPRPIALDTSAVLTKSAATSAAWYCAGPLPIGAQPQFSTIDVANASSKIVRGEIVVSATGGGDHAHRRWRRITQRGRLPPSIQGNAHLRGGDGHQ